MADNKDNNTSSNPLESTADSLAMCINVFASCGLQLASNIVILGSKATWQVVELVSDVVGIVSDVVGIVFRVVTGSYEYENENNYNENYLLEVANTKENKLLNIDKSKIEEYRTNAIDVEYMEIEPFDMSAIPTMCKYKNINVAKLGNLKVCIGIGENNQKICLDMLEGHLLIGGMARKGKSSLVSNIILSLLLNHKKKVKLILSDFKRADVKRFEGCEGVHGKCSINAEEFLLQIKWLRKQANERSAILEKSGFSNLIEYNENAKVIIPYFLFVVDEIPMVMQNEECKKQLHLMMCELPYVGIYTICITQDCSKETIGKMKMNASQKIGLRVNDNTDGNMLMKGAELEEIRTIGRCKIDDGGGEFTEFQSFYLDRLEIGKYLKILKS
jgi:hypothetical protein